jgi:hypothetical protein
VYKKNQIAQDHTTYYQIGTLKPSTSYDPTMIPDFLDKPLKKRVYRVIVYDVEIKNC